MNVERLNSMSFGPKDIESILGVNRSHLFYWSNTHRLFKAEIEEAGGPGERTKYSLKNMIEIAAIKEMVKFGFPLRLIKNVKDQLDRVTFFKVLVNPERALKRLQDNWSVDIITIEEWMEALCIYVYRTKDSVYLEKEELEIVSAIDEFGGGAAEIEPVLKPLIPSIKKKPTGYFAIRFKIGAVVLELAKKIEQVYTDKLTKK